MFSERDFQTLDIVNLTCTKRRLYCMTDVRNKEVLNICKSKRMRRLNITSMNIQGAAEKPDGL